MRIRGGFACFDGTGQKVKREDLHFYWVKRRWFECLGGEDLCKKVSALTSFQVFLSGDGGAHVTSTNDSALRLNTTRQRTQFRLRDTTVIVVTGEKTYSQSIGKQLWMSST